MIQLNLTSAVSGAIMRGYIRKSCNGKGLVGFATCSKFDPNVHYVSAPCRPGKTYAVSDRLDAEGRTTRSCVRTDRTRTASSSKARTEVSASPPLNRLRFLSSSEGLLVTRLQANNFSHLGVTGDVTKGDRLGYIRCSGYKSHP
jgi:hypothetical protein